MRQVDFIFNNLHVRAAKGVYKITIGGKFYIGKAKNLYSRIYRHKSEVNRELLRYPLLKSPTYNHWCTYILENNGIQTALVDLIQRSITDSELFFAEQYFLTEYRQHPDCLNKTWNSTRPSCFFGGEDSFWDVDYLSDGTPYYTDPVNGGEVIYSDADLNCKGKLKK